MLDKSAITKAAQKFTAKGQIDKAIAEWEKLLTENEDGNIYNVVGDLYLKKRAKREAIEAFVKAANIFREDGFYLKAMALYKKILNIAPLEVNALISLAELNAEKGLVGNANENYLAAAEIYVKEGATEKALDLYERILKLTPFNISLKIKIAELYLKIGLKEEAVKEYLVVAADYLEKRDDEKAQEFYLRVIGLDQNNVSALIGLSKIAENADNIKQAYEYLNNAMSFAPDNSDVLFNYSRLSIKTNNVDNAKQALTKLIEIDPSNNQYKKLLGNIYLQENLLEKAWHELLPYIDESLLAERWNEALELLNNFKELEPLAVKRRLTTIYKGKGDKEAAISELKELAGIYESQNLLQDALQSYKELLELDPSDEAAQNRVKELEKSLGVEAVPPEITPLKDKPVEDVLSETDVYVRHGLLKEAIGSLEELNKREPNNIEVHTRLKDLYIESGDKDRAIGECLSIAELYEKRGDLESKNKVIAEATRLNPDDPRLVAISIASPEVEGVVPSVEEEAPENIEEKLSEADFYVQQGLKEEAIRLYKEILSVSPDNEDVIEKLRALKPAEKPEEKLVKPAEKAEGHTAIDSDLKDIFNEFKKGIEEELGEKDYETRYNLGIAYKGWVCWKMQSGNFNLQLKTPKDPLGFQACSHFVIWTRSVILLQ